MTLPNMAKVVVSNVAMIKTNGASRGLYLNDKKCKSIAVDGQSFDDRLLRDSTQLTSSTATLLAVPMVNDAAMEENA